MSAQLTMVFRDPPRTVRETYDDTCAAGEAVAALATEMGAEVMAGLGGAARGGHLLLNRPTAAPIRITEVVADYTIEEG